MDSKKLMIWAGVAIGGYLLYQWLMQNGYLGATATAAGTVPAQTDMPPATTSSGQPASSFPSVFVQPAGVPNPPATTTATAKPPSTAASFAADMKAKLTAAVGNVQATSDQWNYYRNQIYGQNADNDAIFQSAFPAAKWANVPMSVDTFVNGIVGASGLGAIVSTGQVQSMNFGMGAFPSPWGGRGGKRTIN